MGTDQKNKKTQYQEATVLKKIKETKDTVTLILKLSEPFTWLPGQFIMVKAEINGKTVNRAYSISSPPLTEDTLDITIRQTTTPLMSKYLNDIKEGETLLVRGPYGKFYWTEGMSDKVVLIGGGSGITPLKAISEYILAKNLPVDVKMFYSSSHWDEVIYYQKLKNMNEQFENFHLILTITREDPPEPWILKGRFNEELLRKELKDYKDAKYYLCGTPGFVNSMITDLQAIGIEKQQIKHEQWSS